MNHEPTPNEESRFEKGQGDNSPKGSFEGDDIGNSHNATPVNQETAVDVNPGGKTKPSS